MSEPAEILLYPHPRFAAAAKPHMPDDALRVVGARLLATAQLHRAYGLAAVHIGEVEPVVVVSLGPAESRDYHVLYNPRIVHCSTGTAAGTEGSVSLPGVEVEIVRSVSVDIAYDDADGVQHETTLSGFPARVAQHEIDQMNGVFFLDKLSRLKRDAALRRFRKLSR